MGISAQRESELKALAHGFRKDLIEILYSIQTGHPGGSLSVCEILTALYFEKANISPENSSERSRDKIILCKGHAAPMLYRILAEKGFFDVEEMKTLRQIDSRLQGHPCSKTLPGVEATTGPLGAGYPFALGMSMIDKHDNLDSYVYAILGDGELNEGVIWETCMNASKFKADNLITIVDYNKVQLDGTTEEVMPMGNLADKFLSFGFNPITCNGHNFNQLCDAIDKAKRVKGRPSVILANTVKGKGISFMEGKNIWHGRPISQDEYKAAMEELKGAE